MNPIDYFIRCNGTDVHLTPGYGKSPATLDGEWGGEQCEGCGGDIAEWGTVEGPLDLSHVRVGYTRVRCTSCSHTYQVRATSNPNDEASRNAFSRLEGGQ